MHFVTAPLSFVLNMIICLVIINIQLTKGFYLQPGQGYSSYTEDIAESICFIPRNITATGFKSLFMWDSWQKAENLYEQLGIDLETKIAYRIDVDATINYLRSVEETTLSFSMSYFSKIWRTLNIDYPFQVSSALTDDGKLIYGYGAKSFKKFCGDQYITSYDEGAFLILSLKFSFGTKDEKQRFHSQITVGAFPFFNITNTIENIHNKLQISGSMEISTHQIGGDPRQLNKAMSVQSVSCTFNDLSACKAALKALVEYTKVFPEQIDLENEIVGTMPAIGTYTKSPHPFTNKQIDISKAPPISNETMQERENVTRKWDFYMMNKEELSRLKDLGFTPYAPGLLENLANVKLNLELLSTGLTYGPMSSCWYDFEYCVEIKNEIQDNQLPFTFNPDDILYCNDPSEVQISVDVFCEGSSEGSSGAGYYVGDGVFREGSFKTELRLAEKDGKCYASAVGSFRKHKDFFDALFSGSKYYYFTRSCGTKTYYPARDPTPDPALNWLIGWSIPV